MVPMIPRYAHHAITTIWSDKTKYKLWTQAEAAWAASRGFTTTSDWLLRMLTLNATPPFERIAELEQQTQHDVAAWLQAMSELMPNDVANGFHRGLTSSDLVEYSHWASLSSSTSVLWNRWDKVSNRLEELENQHHRTLALARTHGEPAEPAPLRQLFRYWRLELIPVLTHLRDMSYKLRVTKIPGAVGTSQFHTLVQQRTFRERTLIDPVISTQVVNRVGQVHWATTVIQAVIICEQIAMEYRMRARHGEWRRRRGPDHIGSSAMPHKNNPVEAETITGLCRLARAQIAPIMESATLLDYRDISNSSVERVAVVDLCHLAATIAVRTHDLLDGLEIDLEQTQVNMDVEGESIYSAQLLEALLTDHPDMPYVKGHQLVRQWLEGDDDIDTAWIPDETLPGRHV